ncbi:chromobox protein homolog 3-like [Sitodiplosis mosellana]|uniref:chromobox protein homolog 3-like n=1 Tax=Sitodiplosis mosellana TaxID=263140 RepID=UPI002443A599|nr:chromobox protein homolog 3-like [Sitodiplosis mosellana]
MSNDSSLCEVEEILDKRVINNNVEYLVKWKKSEREDNDDDDDSNPDDDSSDDDDDDKEWVSAELCNCPTAIAIYEKSHGMWKEEYEVEGIVDSIEDEDGKMEYLVKWKGFNVSQNTWVKAKNMKDCAQIIKEFEDGDRYHNEEMLEVKEISAYEGRFNGVPTFTIIKENEEEATEELFTIDELYIAINGRKALIEFDGDFPQDF